MKFEIGDFISDKLYHGPLLIIKSIDSHGNYLCTKIYGEESNEIYIPKNTMERLFENHSRKIPPNEEWEDISDEFEI